MNFSVLLGVGGKTGKTRPWPCFELLNKIGRHLGLRGDFRK
ncbi:hypothetical protein HMPREF0577_0923 [Mobiluncus mulieris ATCC 35243]|nr:hypothetical protein HMPREF0577_0923 [Mobiluncus mulieris ATCC 35243]